MTRGNPVTPDQISKLPPELRTHALMCIKGGIFEACLTWGLQVVEENAERGKLIDRMQEQLLKWESKHSAAEATIATLTQRIASSDQKYADAILMRNAAEAEVTRLKGEFANGGTTNG